MTRHLRGRGAPGAPRRDAPRPPWTSRGLQPPPWASQPPLQEPKTSEIDCLSSTAWAALELEPRRTRDLLSLGRRLIDLPEIESALEEGEIGWTKARELARVATRETEAAWLARALEVTSRVLEQEVATSIRGELPPEGDPEPPRRPPRTRLVFEMETVEADLLRDLLVRERARRGPGAAEVGDGVILADLARQGLSQEDLGEAGTAEAWTILLQHCPRCQRTEGLHAEVTDTVASEACCDAQVVEGRAGPDQGKRTRTIPPRIRRQVLARDGHKCLIPGCTNHRWLHLHHWKPFSEGGEHSAENLGALCTTHHRLHHDGRLALTLLSGSRVRIGYADGRSEVITLGQRRGDWRVVRVGGEAGAEAATHVGDAAKRTFHGEARRADEAGAATERAEERAFTMYGATVAGRGPGASAAHGVAPDRGLGRGGDHGGVRSDSAVPEREPRHGPLEGSRRPAPRHAHPSRPESG